MAKKPPIGEEVRSSIKRLAPKDAYHLTTPTIKHHNLTGSPCMDILPRKGHGEPGLPGGKIVELYGLPGSGKTAFAARCAAACQYQGGFVFWISSGEGVDEPFIRMLQVDIDDDNRWMYVEAFTLEAAFGAAQGAILALHDKGIPVIGVIDAVSSLEAKENAMSNKGLDDGQSAAAGAKVCHKFNRCGIQYFLTGTSVTLIVIRHQTENPRPYGVEKTTHGSAFDYSAWLRLKFRKKPLMKSASDKTLLGSWIEVKCTKSKMGWHGWKHSMPLYWDYGWDPGMEILTWLLDNCKDIKTDATGRVCIPELSQNKFPSQWRKDYATDEGLQHEMQTILLERFRQLHYPS